MKIVTASSGKQSIKVSRAEWQAIGKQAGWEDETPIVLDPRDNSTREQEEGMNKIQDHQWNGRTKNMTNWFKQ